MSGTTDHLTPVLGLPRVEPGEVGMSAARLGRIGVALGREVEAGRLPGAVIGIARRGRLAWLQSIGHLDASGRTAMPLDGVFAIASMTKPMVSVVIMQLIEEGRLTLNDPVADHLPELGSLQVAGRLTEGGVETVPVERSPTIQDLLRHTSGLTYQSRGDSAVHQRYPGSSVTAALKIPRTEFLATIARAPLLFQPGSAWEYGFSTDVLGYVIEAVEGRALGEVLSDRLWRPLGMSQTGFALRPGQTERYAEAFANDPLTGEPQIYYNPARERMLWESGGGGALSTVGDYLRFAEMLAQGGALAGTRIIGRKTVELMRSDHLAPGQGDRIAETMDPNAAGYGFGLGFAVRREAGRAAQPGTVGDYYWSGVFGTYFWIDPIEELTCVYLAATPGQMRIRTRAMVRSLVYQALE